MNHKRCRPLVFLTLLLAALTARAESSATADPPSSAACHERHDELWIVSTRNCGCPCGCEITSCELDVRRCECEGECQWHESTLDEFLAGDPLRTVIYVHGNRVDWWEAQRRGRMAYHALVSCDGEIPPLRFVIWSWPSDQMRGPLRDIRVKADRADAEGSYFAWFFLQLKPDTPISLIGYSYGARIIGGGLHLAARSRMNELPATAHDTLLEGRVRTAYLAPATPNCWLCIGNCHGQSLGLMEHLLILYNTCDPALARFRYSERCSRPAALGFTGINGSCLGEAASRVEQRDVCCQVGKTHAEEAYWCNSAVACEVSRAVLWDMPTQAGPEPESTEIDLELNSPAK